MATHSKSAPGVQSLIEMAMLHIRSGNPDEAVVLFEQATRMQPRNAQLLNNLGYSYQLAGQPTQALKAYQKALKRAPTDTLTLCNLGLLQKKIGETDAAQATFDRALAFDPTDVNLLCNRANILLDKGHADQALIDYDRAARLEPDNPSVLNGRASALSDLNRLEAARKDVDRAVQLKPAYARAWSNRGDVYRDMNQLDEALRSYDKALELQPGDAKTLANLAGLAVTKPEEADTAIARSIDSLKALTLAQYGQSSPFTQRVRHCGVSLFRLRHDLGQARYQQEHGIALTGLDRFVQTAAGILNRAHDNAHAEMIPVDENELQGLLAYWQTPYQVNFESPTNCLNPNNDWSRLQAEYLAGKPEILVIDNFLSEPALKALRHYCLASRVWTREYPNRYLGAFANQGFISPLHMQLACELRAKMPLIFRDYPLNQLWGFKYDTKLGKGINIHADFALVNLNFWITPDEFHMNKDHGGLKVYETPAPADWTFHDYNTDSQTMYDYLARNNSGCQVIPHRYNRAVLFNSALFHETDEIDFADNYVGRRINITYLFGRQLN